MYPEALASDKRWIATHPSQSRDPYSLAVSASIYGLQGRNEEAEALIKELRETARHRYVSGFFFAEAYVGLAKATKQYRGLNEPMKNTTNGWCLRTPIRDWIGCAPNHAFRR